MGMGGFGHMFPFQYGGLFGSSDLDLTSSYYPFMGMGGFGHLFPFLYSNLLTPSVPETSTEVRDPEIF